MGTRGVGMLGDNAMRWFHVRDRSSHAGIARDRSHALLLPVTQFNSLSSCRCDNKRSPNLLRHIVIWALVSLLADICDHVLQVGTPAHSSCTSAM